MLLMLAPAAQGQKAAEALAHRVLGDKAGQFKFELRNPEGTAQKGRPTDDFFQILQKGRKIVIAGNSDNSMAMGLNYYLKQVAHVSVSWYATQPVELPERLPRVERPIEKRCELPARFFLNYCTYGYTMVWWQWEQWERFIDWMALNGVNMPLSLTGQEAVWQEVWREFGMSDDEIRAYFSGPAHLPWHRMANLDGFGGPLPQAWIDGQKELQKRIVARERELGMKPVLPAFAGHVPRQIAERYPQADIKQLSSWCGFEPTCFLNSTDSLFARIQRSYLEKQTALYGTDHIYGVDPFNEMDPPSWEPDYLASVSRNIYASLQQVDGDARWLQMTWVFYYKRKQWTPERLRAYLTAVPQGRMVLLDYFCENTEVWRQTDGFYGQPFIWCYLGNFGGNTMLVGDLYALADKIRKLGGEERPASLMGMGSTLESFDCSPQIFEFLLSRPWERFGLNGQAGGTEVREWVQEWADARYGSANQYARQAWQLLQDSVYKDWSYYGLGTQMTARPTLDGHGTYYTKPYYSYDNDALLRAVRLLLKEPSPRAAYFYDVTNLFAQWMGNQFNEVRDAFTTAYERRDLKMMQRAETVCLNLIGEADALLEMSPEQSLMEWDRQAAQWCRTAEDSAYYARQAHTILTIWGGPILNDYANRMWGGLLVYYFDRWRQFFAEVTKAVKEGREFDPAAFDKQLKAFEQYWADSTQLQVWEHTDKHPSACDADRYSTHRNVLEAVDDELFEVWDPRREQMRKRLREYVERYPRTQLQDVYKWCFQDVYGPAHIIKDSAACRRYIEEELAFVKDGDTNVPFEYTGIDSNYVRVNLSLVKQGVVPVEVMVDALMRSAAQKHPLPVYEWRGRWQRLQVELSHLPTPPDNFDADSQKIAEVLQRNEYVMHHSKQFNEAYDFHYRIVRRDIFEKELREKICGVGH